MRGIGQNIPLGIRLHTHTQVMPDGTMLPIPLHMGGGDGSGDSTNGGDSEPSHDGGHGSDGDGNWGG